MITGVTLSVLVAKLRGGHIRRLAEVKLDFAGLAFAAIFLQYYVRLAGPRGWLLIPALAPYVLATGFLCLFTVLWINRHLPGVPIIGLGAASNFVATFLNGGRMPVAAEAFVALGMNPDRGWEHIFSHQLITQGTHLPWLADVVPVKIPLLSPWLLPSTPMSLGDLVSIAGAFYFIQVAMGTARLSFWPLVSRSTAR